MNGTGSFVFKVRSKRTVDADDDAGVTELQRDQIGTDKRSEVGVYEKGEEVFLHAQKIRMKT